MGGGIAGASLAYFLCCRGIPDIVLLEREDQPGCHSTGRSAATLNTFDFDDSVRRLKLLGAKFLRDPPAGFADGPILARTGVLLLFAGADWEAAQRVARQMTEREGETLAVLDPDAARRRIPPLAPAQFDGAIWAPDDGRIDVDRLLQGYLRGATRAGAEVRCGAEVTEVIARDGRCRGVVAGGETVEARRVVNAAGAWAGRLGALAGALPIELTPKRRTIIAFAPPADLDVADWPLVCNESRGLYFGPEAGGLLASPMDVDPMEPCDARPDELGVARAIDRLEAQAPSLVPRALRAKWAGLRTFAPDDRFVIGDDPTLPGFFWLAGQGGAGIETSPAAGRVAADLIADGDCADYDVSLVSPARFVGIAADTV